MGAVSNFLESATNVADKVAGAVVDKVPAAIGAFAGGPLGAAIGSGVGSAMRGGGLGDVVKSGVVGYGGSSLFSGGGGGLDSAIGADSAQFGVDPGSYSSAAGGYVGDAFGAGAGAPWDTGDGSGAQTYGYSDSGATRGAAVPAWDGSGMSEGDPIMGTGDAGQMATYGGSPGAALPVSAGSTGLPDSTGLATAGDEARKRAARAGAAQATSPGTSPANTGIMNKIISGVTKNPLAALTAGANVLSQISSNSAGKTAAGRLDAMGRPIQELSTSLLDQYRRGELNPSTAFDINRWEQEQIATMRNYYAKAGMGDSQAARQKMADIKAKAASMRDQARQGLLASGLNAAGIAQGPMTAAISAQAQQDAALSSASSKALQSLMLLQAASSGQRPATPPG